MISTAASDGLGNEKCTLSRLAIATTYKREILPTARELGIGIVAYRVLADGLLSGSITDEPVLRNLSKNLLNFC